MASRKKDKKPFKPGGKKGKLHRELGIPTDEKIPKSRLRKAAHSTNATIARDAKRAETMEKWNHTGPKGRRGRKRKK